MSDPDLYEEIDIGSLTHCLTDNMADIMDIWMRKPHRRHEYGKREMDDLIATAFALGVLIQELNNYIDNKPAPHLRVVN